MADDVNFLPAAEFQALPLENIIAAPLLGVIKAQAAAATATQAYINSLIKDGKPTTIDLSLNVQDGEEDQQGHRKHDIRNDQRQNGKRDEQVLEAEVEPDIEQGNHRAQDGGRVAHGQVAHPEGLAAVQGQVVAPDGDHQRDAQASGRRQHALERDAQGVHQVRLD